MAYAPAWYGFLIGSAYADDRPLSWLFRIIEVGSVFLGVADLNEFVEHFVIGPMLFFLPMAQMKRAVL